MKRVVLSKILPLARWFVFAGFGAALFLSPAQHFFNLWERPAWLLLASGVPGISLATMLVGFWWTKLAPHLEQIGRRQLGWFILAALLTGGFVAWRAYQPPVSYHSLTITPLISEAGSMELLELKADNLVIEFAPLALAGQWESTGEILTATSRSQPLTISFPSRVNTPVTLLFRESSPGGALRLELDRQTLEIAPNVDTGGLRVVTLTARYRGLPNWLFLPWMILVDLGAVGGAVFTLLVLQTLGQGAVSPERGPAQTHRRNLFILLLTGFILHLLNALAVPLLVSSDSRLFMQGALHWLEFGNFEGVSPSVGPGTTFLFAPVLWMFGNNPWGPKILLHFIALAAVPVSYWLGWQISQNRRVAFLSGLVLLLFPDAYFYANYVMTDVPNLFAVLLFCALLFSTCDDLRFSKMLALMALGGFASLLRSENTLLILLGGLTLAASIFRRWLGHPLSALKLRLVHLVIALLVAILPVVWWSNQNLKMHGFWGLSNYMGLVLYDGWVYFGDASNLSFSDPDSESVQKIQRAIHQHPIVITDKKGYATGWEIYPALLQSGYTSQQAMDLFKNAALDSIQKNPQRTVQLLFLKLSTGLRPEVTHPVTYPLPGEAGWGQPVETGLFGPDQVSLTFPIILQRPVYDGVTTWYPWLYPVWSLLCVLALYLSCFRQPMEKWLALGAIIASRILLPLSLSVPFWRYTLSGWFPLQVVAIGWMLLLVGGLMVVFKPQGGLNDFNSGV